MRLFKTIKRKVGNAIVPVIGSILGLTILAGTVVAVAVNSSRIVYRQNNLEQNNDARQILYLACKYFCTEINNGKTDTQIRSELQEIFGPGLKITKDTVDTEKYYIWYPNKFADSRQKEYDPSKDNSQVTEWLKATITKSEQSDDNGDHGNTGINNTLFSQEAKLDEKFAIGNMMTVYLTDEHLLPGRKYSINEVSLVESDIDTFDEAFTYMNNSGVLEIDDIAVALYKYGVISNNSVSYINANSTGTYEIVYKTGNLGGNYYWANVSKGTDTWLYRQEYDIDLLYDMICYQKASNSSISKSNLKYYYDETNDSHKIYSTPDGYELNYSSSQRFAEAIADYIFWKNMPRLCMYLDDFVTAIKNDCKSKKPGYTDFVDLNNLNWYEWKDEGITIRPSYVSGSMFSGYIRYYTEIDYKDSDVINLFQTNNTLKNKYCKNGVLDRNLLYEALITKIKTNMFSNNSEAIENAYKAIIKSEVLTTKSKSGSDNNWIYREPRSGYNKYYYYYWNDNEWLNQVVNKNGDSNDVLHKAIEEFLLGRLTIKYVTGTAEKEPEKLDGGVVEEIVTNGLGQFQYFNEDNNTSMCVKYHYHAKVHLHPENPSQVDDKDYYSEQTGDTFYFKADGIYMGDEKIYSYSYKSGRETFVRTFIEAFASKCSVSVSSLYTEEEITKITRNQVMKNLVKPIQYQYIPTNNFSEIVGTGSTSSYGMKEQSIANKLLTFYLENNESDLKQTIGDLDYDIVINSITYKDDLGESMSNYLNMVIDFKIVIHKPGGNQDVPRKVSFVIQYMTYSAQNVATYNSITDTYTNVLNGNFSTDTDEDGQVKHVFSPVVIKNSSGDALSYEDINSGNVRPIISNVPYVERINSTQVPYKDHKITIDGVDYTTTKDTSALTNVTANTLYDGDLNNLSSNFKIKVADGKSLFINGDLSLKDNQEIELGKNSLLFVNGSMQVRYQVNVDMRYDDGYWTRELWTSDYNTFVNNGVDIIAAENAKIMINGNFDYRGFKAKQAKKNSRGFNVYNAETGEYDYVDTNVIYEQYVLNADFKDRYGDQLGQCTQNADGTWTHYPYECRGKLQGIYIINGDMNFHAWDENNLTDNSYNDNIAMYRNMYSNPAINATFYVDGVFDMRGLYTSGLYDKCRSNFVFAKSIVEPRVALNTVLCQGSHSNYGAWRDSDGSWTHSQGYLFMICEDAIDFSEVNFACVNLFTPFQELVNAINANKESSTNFSEFIDKGAFTAMFPNKSVIDEWGLPSILRSGLGQLYDPGDIGAITPEDHIYGTPV